MAEPELGTFHLGANFDTRPPAQAAREDVTAAEVIASAAAVDWKEIAPADIRVFGMQDQGSKSDCVAETRRKLKRIMLKVNKGLDLDFSSLAFYRKRVNFPGEGMIAADAIQLDQNIGMTLDSLVPSDAVRSEAAANAIAPDAFNDDIAKVFRTGDTDIVFTPGDLETMAGTIQKTRKGIMVWFYATVGEWSKLVPTIDIPDLTLRDSRVGVIHSTAAIEPALYNGQKGFWIDDSAHFGGLSRRFITEAFFKKRNWFASYPQAFKFEAGSTVKPHYFFAKDLEFSPTFFTDADVVALQEILKFEGVFPLNVDSTGYFGALTLEAVKKLQVKHGIKPISGYVGSITRTYLNGMYS
jgi:hypothetical protein